MTKPSVTLKSSRASLLRQLESAEEQRIEVEVEFVGELGPDSKPGHHFTRGIPAVDGDGYVQLTATDGRESWWYPVLVSEAGDVPAIVAVLPVDGGEGRLELLDDDGLDSLIKSEMAKLDVTPSDQLDQALKVAEVAMLFGQVERTTEHPDGRRETDTTHTVMLGLLALELAPPELRRDRVLAAVLVHDLTETFADDTCTAWGLTPDARADKEARELAALEQLRALGLTRIVELIEDYERQESPEVRWVRYVDKVLPKLTHLLNLGQALRSIGMTRAHMLEQHGKQAAELLAAYPEQGHARTLFEAAADRCEAELDFDPGRPVDADPAKSGVGYRDQDGSLNSLRALIGEPLVPSVVEPPLLPDGESTSTETIEAELTRVIGERNAALDDIGLLKGVIAEQLQEIADLRAALDPGLLDRCSCCRSCGPTRPCMGIVRGDGCEGLCYCGLPDDGE